METLRQDFALFLVFCQIFSLGSLVLVQWKFLVAKGYIHAGVFLLSKDRMGQ